MSFGWIFGTSDGTILAEHAGPAFGTPTSHRAEGWGMLSGARFLLHLCRYRRIPLPQHLHIESVSDNAGLITRMQNRRTYVTVFANATLEPDWDITEQIHASFEDIQPVTHKYAWERGHQDNTTNYTTNYPKSPNTTFVPTPSPTSLCNKIPRVIPCHPFFQQPNVALS
jgi:hypothetical protein